MASPEREAAAAVVEDVLRMHGEGLVGGAGGGGEVVVVMGRNIDMAGRKAEVTAVRRNEAANWLRRTVGVVCARDLAEEPSEEEFRVGLRNGIILCSAVNKIQPGTVPKVVEVHSVSTIPADGSALCAYQYFENVRNFLTGLQDLGLPTFEVSDLEKGGQGVRVVDCVLALKSFSETKQLGKQSLFKHGGIVKPSMSAKCQVRKNEPFMKTMTRSHSAELLRDGKSLEQTLHLDCSLEPSETITSDSIKMLVQTILSDKKPEEVPSLVESLLSKVIQEFERRMANQNDLVKYTVDPNDSSPLSRTESTDTPQEMDATSISDHGKTDGEDHNSVTNHVKMDEEDNNSVTNHVTMDEEDNNSVTNHVTMDEGDHNYVSATGEVSSSVPVNSDNVEKYILAMAKAEIQFELQQKQIQDLKSSICTVKSGIAQFKVQYSDDLTKLGKHLRTISHAASGYHKVLEENRKLYNQIQDLRGNIRVYCRVRPFLPGKESASSSVAGVEDRTITIMTAAKHAKDARKSFTFNRVFGPLATQAEVFADMQPLVRSVLDGYNVCIFAYGQTGSGKTFTMSGPKILTEEGLGVNYRALNDLFDMQAQRKDTFCYEISVQMLEIYNEHVRDLLHSGPNKKLEIRNSSQKGIAVPDANIVPVASTSDVVDLMNLGQKNRAVCSTAMNDRSSRSHSCVTVHVQGRDLTSGTVLRGCMHLVDLAGSERVDKSEVVGDRLKEAQHINKSLAALGDVIASLAQKNAHVPYRNSKLTQLLQDSLGGQAKTLMFIHIAPEPDAVGESISTLKFAERVATVELGAAKTNKDGEVKDLKEQIACLRAALASKDGENENIRSSHSSPDILRDIKVGHTSPASGHTMEEVRCLETRSNGSPRQTKPNFELSDVLVESDPSSWLDTCNGDNTHLRSSNSLPELGPDATHDLALYQRSSPEQQRSWAGSVATEDSDDCEVATTCSSEHDSVRPASAPKASAFANGGGSVPKKAQTKSVKGTDIRVANPAKKANPLPKKANGTAHHVPIKNGKQSAVVGVDVRKTPNGKVSTKK